MALGDRVRQIREADADHADAGLCVHSAERAVDTDGVVVIATGEQQWGEGREKGDTQTTKRVVYIEQTTSSDIFLGKWPDKNSAGAVLGQELNFIFFEWT